MAQAILLKDVDGPRCGRRRGRRLPRLPAQLPRPAQARPAGDPGVARGGAAPPRAAEKAAREAEARAGETAALLSKTVLTIQHRAGEDGKLYGSVTSAEIADAIAEARGLKIDRKKIRLDEPIREIGTYMVEIELPGGATAKVKTIVAEAEVAPAASRAWDYRFRPRCGMTSERAASRCGLLGCGAPVRGESAAAGLN